MKKFDFSCRQTDPSPDPSLSTSTSPDAATNTTTKPAFHIDRTYTTSDSATTSTSISSCHINFTRIHPIFPHLQSSSWSFNIFRPFIIKPPIFTANNCRRIWWKGQHWARLSSMRRASCQCQTFLMYPFKFLLTLSYPLAWTSIKLPYLPKKLNPNCRNRYRPLI